MPANQLTVKDVADDRRVLVAQSWSPRADLLVLNEIHNMPNWKGYLKGVFDGRTEGQAILVTGSARMDTFRQSGKSLAGRYFQVRLHPFSVREWVELTGAKPDDALDRLIERGGLPEPFLAGDSVQALCKRFFSDASKPAQKRDWACGTSRQASSAGRFTIA